MNYQLAQTRFVLGAPSIPSLNLRKVEKYKEKQDIIKDLLDKERGVRKVKDNKMNLVI